MFLSYQCGGVCDTQLDTVSIIDDTRIYDASRRKKSLCFRPYKTSVLNSTPDTSWCIFFLRLQSFALMLNYSQLYVYFLALFDVSLLFFFVSCCVTLRKMSRKKSSSIPTFSPDCCWKHGVSFRPYVDVCGDFCHSKLASTTAVAYAAVITRTLTYWQLHRIVSTRNILILISLIMWVYLVIFVAVMFVSRLLCHFLAIFMHIKTFCSNCFPFYWIFFVLFSA